MSTIIKASSQRLGAPGLSASAAPLNVTKVGTPESLTLAQRQRIFNETYGAWIDAQNEHFERHGLWCDGLVSWMEPA